jgi:membrane protein implicated in regulation of membrane protease activity
MQLEWWHWMVAGLALGMGELAVGSFFIIWFGLGAMVVGLAMLVAPTLGFTAQLSLWTLASVTLTVLWFKVFRQRGRIETGSMQCAPGRRAARGVQHKLGNGRIKTVAFVRDEEIAAMHGAAGSTQTAGAGVLESLSGPKQRLLPYHPQTLDFVNVALLVLDDPVARNQLNRGLASVGHCHGVGERINILQGIALVGHVLGQHINMNLVYRHYCMLTATILT